MSRCPTSDDLEQFLAEGCDRATEEKTSRHLAGCPRGARTLSILRESTDEEVHIEADADRVLVRGAYNEFEMPSGTGSHT